MPVQNRVEDTYLSIYASGKLDENDYPGMTAAFDHYVQQHGSARVLLDMTAMEGWKANAIGPELRFDSKHLGSISRLAIVGSKEWQHALTSVSKPFTNAEIRYYDSADAAEAKDWLRQS